MKVGRPQKFDRTTALERAMLVFWEKGYAGTSVRDLLGAMGINRGSMYNSFGDKQSLFLQAVEHYCTNSRDSVSVVLKQPGSPMDNVREVVRSWADTAAAGPSKGCLVTNTAVELAPHIREVADTLIYHFSRLERMLRNALDRAVDSDELPHHTDTRALARFLVTTDQGLMVIGRAGASKETIDDVAEVALAMLRASRKL
jgi:TetR/AcrR family transcriptional repressor of nem operon